MEDEAMMWIVALTMLLFQGLAVCTLGGMLSIGTSTHESIFMAVLVVILGVIITRAMYRDVKRVHF